MFTCCGRKPHRLGAVPDREEGGVLVVVRCRKCRKMYLIHLTEKEGDGDGDDPLFV